MKKVNITVPKKAFLTVEKINNLKVLGHYIIEQTYQKLAPMEFAGIRVDMGRTNYVTTNYSKETAGWEVRISIFHAKPLPVDWTNMFLANVSTDFGFRPVDIHITCTSTPGLVLAQAPNAPGKHTKPLSLFDHQQVFVTALSGKILKENLPAIALTEILDPESVPESGTVVLYKHLYGQFWYKDSSMNREDNWYQLPPTDLSIRIPPT